MLGHWCVSHANGSNSTTTTMANNNQQFHNNSMVTIDLCHSTGLTYQPTLVIKTTERSNNATTPCLKVGFIVIASAPITKQSKNILQINVHSDHFFFLYSYDTINYCCRVKFLRLPTSGSTSQRG